MNKPQIVLLTALAMIAFAASFTAVRLAAGALTLWLIVRLRGGGSVGDVGDVGDVGHVGHVGHVGIGGHGSWRSALALFTYAAGFSFAYLSLPAATGALLLFGAVQVTMISYGLWRGERFSLIQGGGLALACAGFVGLMLPGLATPPLGGAVLMILAGVAWGIYSLRGRGVGDATASTAGNFIRALPFAAALSLMTVSQAAADLASIGYAVVSGALASGLGYAVWYSALRGLRATHAATVQLSVRVIAALGGALVLDEAITLRLILASVAVLGGIALVISGRRATA